jgi:hypothetical protein
MYKILLNIYFFIQLLSSFVNVIFHAYISIGLELLPKLLDILMRSLAASAHKEGLEMALFIRLIDHLGQLNLPRPLNIKSANY